MKEHSFNFFAETLVARGSGALLWPSEKILTVSDLHLGKSERIARRGGPFLPPYETRETLARLAEDIQDTDPAVVICLGDSFDDLQSAQSLNPQEIRRIVQLQAGRKWIWIEGNHDPGPVAVGGTHLKEFIQAPLIYRHIASSIGAGGEISGHFHPKHTLRAKGRAITRPCFIYDETRVILPAYGAYTGGLGCTSPALQALFGTGARIVMTGPVPHVLPWPRGAKTGPQPLPGSRG